MKLQKSMFSYQCRYCKANFEQWEKLVKHRSDNHVEEFEALKAAAAALLVKRPEKMEPRSGSDDKRCHNILTTSKRRGNLSPRMITFSSSPSSTLFVRTSPKVSSSASRKVDEKDLENQEIKFCVPEPEEPSSSASSSKLITPHKSPYSHKNGILSPPESPFEHRSQYHSKLYNGNNTSTSYLTPPSTPTPSTSSSLPGEIVLNMNWVVPHSKKAVMYHEMKDEDEIEFCVTPSSSTGTSISLTKHASPINQPSWSRKLAEGPREIIRIRRPANHVMLEKLDDELQMTCTSACSGESGRVAYSSIRKEVAHPGQMKLAKRNEERLPLRKIYYRPTFLGYSARRKLIQRRIFSRNLFYKSANLRLKHRASLQRSSFKRNL